MQEKKQNFSPIKQRILSFAASLGISKRDFYAKIGVSRGTLESKTGITEDIITKFFATYPEVNINWLMTGRGEMIAPTAPLHPTEKGDVLKTKSSQSQQICDNNLISNDKNNNNSFINQTFITDIIDKFLTTIKNKDEKITKQAEEIGMLKQTIKQLEREKEELVSAVNGFRSANVD